ncbi:hypothetical protein ACMY0W_11135 [Bacteroides sp. KG69]|uniref:hypothetical protein n=1 Tax=Bacteroides sp. KG69 TaxID=3397825 RepID=UPI003D959CA8
MNYKTKRLRLCEAPPPSRLFPRKAARRMPANGRADDCPPRPPPAPGHAPDGVHHDPSL